MNAMIPTPQHDRQSLTTITHVMYALHVATWFSAGIFSVIAVIINYVKRGDLPDDFFRSHFRWQARSFWFTLLWFVLAAPLWALWLPGAFAYAIIGLWYLYRFVRGWLAFADGRAMPVPPT
jgi:uncharacterized membrane protein